ncbi:hypothetical protein, conserved, partial [Eimeria necatrix]
GAPPGAPRGPPPGAPLVGFEVPAEEAGKSAAAVGALKAEKFFWDRRSRSQRACGVLERGLRALGEYCWDPGVTLLLLQGGPPAAAKGEKKVLEALGEVAESLESHPDHRVYVHLSARVVHWSRAQLELPRLHSPLAFAAAGSSSSSSRRGEPAAAALLQHVLQLDAQLKLQTAKLSAGLSPQDIYSPHFDKLVALALTARQYPLPRTAG